MHDIERARAALQQLNRLEDEVRVDRQGNEIGSPSYQRRVDNVVRIYCAMLQAEATDRPQVRYSQS